MGPPLGLPAPHPHLFMESRLGQPSCLGVTTRQIGGSAHLAWLPTRHLNRRSRESWTCDRAQAAQVTMNRSTREPQTQTPCVESGRVWGWKRVDQPRHWTMRT